MPEAHKKVLDQIIFLYKGYSNEHRATTQPFHLEKVKAHVKDYIYKYDDLLVREPLIEHSGSLPIIATAIYPHLQDPNVDLGRALTMLAIHDIGEIVTGDEMTFLKTKDPKIEQKQALLILDKSFHEIYMEVEELRSDTARFAKSVDRMTPGLIDLITPIEITVERYKMFTKKKPEEIVPLLRDYNYSYMTWNPFMTNLYTEILERLGKKLKP